MEHQLSEGIGVQLPCRSAGRVQISTDAWQHPADPCDPCESAILHDLGLTDGYSAQERFEVDGANAARSFLKERGHSGTSDPIGVGRHCASYLHTTRSIALHKEPEVAVTHS